MSQTLPGPNARAVRDANDPLVGRIVDGRYKITGVIARGGMSRVYRAEQAPLGRPVALKVLTIGQGGEQDNEFRQRFTLEASASGKLTHPNTVRVFDHGQVGEELLYIAMEYLDGRTLHQVIRAEAPLSAERLISLARQVCGSLREAHGQGLLHRDLKPANVVLMEHGDEQDFVKVLDFGLVKQMRVNDELTGTDAVVGSPSYMSPEQIRAERLDARSDIYSLGVILYAGIAGKAPFVSDTSVGVLLAHLNQPPPPLDPALPALASCSTLGWVVSTCLKKRPDERFANVDELVRALRICDAELRGERPMLPSLVDGKLERNGDSSQRSPPLPPPGGSLGEPSASTVVSAIRSRRLPILAATGLVASFAFFGGAVVVGGVGWWWWQGQDAATRTHMPAIEATTGENGGNSPEITAAEAVAALTAGVRVTVTPPEAVIHHAGKLLGSGARDLPIPEGETWTVEVSADGYESTVESIRWDEIRRPIVLRPGGSGSGAPKAEPSGVRPASSSGGSSGTSSAAANVAPSEPTEPTPTPASTEASTIEAPPEDVAPKKKTGGSDLRNPWD